MRRSDCKHAWFLRGGDGPECTGIAPRRGEDGRRSARDEIDASTTVAPGIEPLVQRRGGALIKTSRSRVDLEAESGAAQFKKSKIICIKIMKYSVF
jgi:hypothetical protein